LNYRRRKSVVRRKRRSAVAAKTEAIATKTDPRETKAGTIARVKAAASAAVIGQRTGVIAITTTTIRKTNPYTHFNQLT
jgi:hypothetical protein